SENERLAYQNRYKEAQKKFTLSRLKKIERNRNLLINPLISLKRQQESHQSFSEGMGKMSWFTRIFLFIISILTMGLINKQLLDMSWKEVVNNPTTLITNFSPSKLAELDEKNGRNIKVESQPTAIYETYQNEYTVK